jgi:hypothetical protein
MPTNLAIDDKLIDDPMAGVFHGHHRAPLQFVD